MAEDADLAGIHSEHEFMDALRVLKARSGLSYRDIVGRTSRADPRHAAARSTLADLLAGNSLPRRPGQLRLLLEVLAAELNEPEQVGRYMQTWSRLIAARSDAGPRAAPAAAALPATAIAPAAPAASVLSRSVPLYVYPPDPPTRAATSPDQAPPRGRNLGAVLIWLVLSMAFFPAVYVIGWLFWAIWVAFTIPLLLIIAAGNGRRRPALRDAPSAYLRAEYRASWPAAHSGLVSRRY